MLGAHDRIRVISLEQVSPMCCSTLVSNLPFLAEGIVPFCLLCAAVKAIFLTFEELHACTSFDLKFTGLTKRGQTPD